MKSLIQTLLSLLSFSILMDAMIKRYAAKKGIAADSPEAVLGFYKNAAKKVLVTLLIAIPAFGVLVYYNEESLALFGWWLNGITRYTGSLSELGLFSLFLVGLLELSVTIFWVVLKLLESEDKIQEAAHRAMVVGAKICLGVAIFAFILAEVDSVAIGGISKAFKMLRNISLRNTALYVSIAAYLAAIGYFTHLIGKGLDQVCELLWILRNRLKIAMEESKKAKTKTKIS